MGAVVEGLGFGVGPLAESCGEFFGSVGVQRASGQGEITVSCGTGQVEGGGIVLRDDPREDGELRHVGRCSAREVVEGGQIAEIAELPFHPHFLHFLAGFSHQRLVEDRDEVGAVVRSAEMEMIAALVREKRVLLLLLRHQLLRDGRVLLRVDVAQNLAAFVSQFRRHGEVSVENNHEPLGSSIEHDLETAILVMEISVAGMRDPVRVEPPNLGEWLFLHRRSRSRLAEYLREVVRCVRFQLLLSLVRHHPLGEHVA